MFINYQQDQQFLLPPSIDELLPEDHLARVLNEIAESLDLGQVKEKYADFGRPAYHPKMLVKILFYGYAAGIRSSRKIAKALETDIAFMWLSAMNRPDFRTISDFRKNNRGAVENLFSQIVATCVSSGMATVGKIAIDGTKIKASASKASIRNEDQLSRMLDSIDQKINEMLEEAEEADREEDRLYGDKRGDELPEELKDEQKRRVKIKEALQRIDKERNRDGSKKKISLTDTSSSQMRTTSGIRPAYNAQAVSSEEGYILAAEVSNQVSDNNWLKPMAEKTRNISGIRPHTILADAGYYSRETLNYIEEESLDAYIPILQNIDKNKARGRSKNNKYDYFQKEEFTYKRENDLYICPAGKPLSFYKIDKKKTKTLRRYKCREKACQSAYLCTHSKNGRTIDRLEHEDLYIKMREKMKGEEAKAIYRKRQAMVEPIFSIIKGPLGFDKFSLRGLEKAKAEWLLACSAFNIFKIWKTRQRMANIGVI